MTTYTQVATILQKSLGHEEGLLVLEYLEARVPPDVARQRDVQASEAATERKISETEAALRLETEQVRAAIRQSEVVTERKISETEAALRLEIEKVRADLSIEIEKVRADLSVQIERSTAAQTRWAFLFWISQMVVLAGLLFTVLSRLQP